MATTFIGVIEDIAGKNVTVTNLVYNKVDKVNPNFFDENNGGLASLQVSKAVSKWFIEFRKLAITFYLICLLVIGIRVIFNSTPQGITKAKSLFMEWLKGFLYLVFMPYGIWMLFKLNEALVQYISDLANHKRYALGGSVISDGTMWSRDEIEFRSPEYISLYTGTTLNGNDSGYELEKMDTNSANMDLIKIAEAMSVLTYKLDYCIIWFILIGQLVSFVYIYYKRYLMISFLIAAFPIMCIFQAIGIMKDGKARAIQGWLGELISNIFMQFLQAIVYTLITSIVFRLLMQTLASTQGGSLTINWFIIIIAINFVPEGEKTLRKILKALAQGSSAEGAGEGGVKKAMQTMTGGAKQIGGAFKGFGK